MPRPDEVRTTVTIEEAESIANHMLPHALSCIAERRLAAYVFAPDQFRVMDELLRLSESDIDSLTRKIVEAFHRSEDVGILTHPNSD